MTEILLKGRKTLTHPLLSLLNSLGKIDQMLVTTLSFPKHVLDIQ